MEPTRSALIVANYRFADPSLRLLRAPAEDAEALAEVLGDPEIGAFQVRTVVNQPAHEVDRAIEAFFADRTPDDLLLLHFSGHGVKDESGDLYFAAADTDLKLLAATAVSAEFVNRLMSRTRSRRVVLFLDCCYAGAFERGLTSRGDTELHLAERLGGRGRAVITASTAMEYAFEGTELTDGQATRPSVFTSAVVEGLRSGDADTDQDGLIGLDELYDYVYDRVRSVTPNQTPSKWALGFQGELYLARRSTPVTTPAPLPDELSEALASPFTGVRAAAVEELGRLAHGTHAGRVLAARQALERMTGDDSRSVAAAAAALLADTPAPTAPELPQPGTPATAVEPEAVPEASGPVATQPADQAGTDSTRQPADQAGTESARQPVREPATHPAPAVPTGGQPVRNRRRVLVGAAGAAAVLAVGGVWWSLAAPNGGSGGSGGASGGGGGAAATVPGTSIVVTTSGGGGRLLEVDSRSGTTTPVTGARNPRSPTISPDRSLIAYISGAGSQAVPRVIGADGTGDRPFLSDASHCRRSNRPAWSPDGSEVVVVCRDDATPTLLLLRADGTFVRDLPTTAVPWGNPTWVQGPQGPAVVFAQTGGGSTDTELWAIDPSSPGNQPVQVTRGPADSHADGAEDKLLFLRGTVPRADLGTVVIKDKRGIGRGEQELTALGEVSSPAWSPDATEIAYLKQGSLWVASADGSNAHRLPVGGQPGPPAWGSR